MQTKKKICSVKNILFCGGFFPHTKTSVTFKRLSSRLDDSVRRAMLLCASYLRSHTKLCNYDISSLVLHFIVSNKRSPCHLFWLFHSHLRGIFSGNEDTYPIVINTAPSTLVFVTLKILVFSYFSDKTIFTREILLCISSYLGLHTSLPWDKEWWISLWPNVHSFITNTCSKNKMLETKPVVRPRNQGGIFCRKQRDCHNQK